MAKRKTKKHQKNQKKPVRKKQGTPKSAPKKNVGIKIANLFKIAASTLLTMTFLTASRPSDPDPKEMSIGQLVEGLEAGHSEIPYVYDIPLEGCSTGHDINKVMASENTDFFFGDEKHSSKAGQAATLTLIGRINDPDKILVAEVNSEDQGTFDYMHKNPGKITVDYMPVNEALKHGIRVIAADPTTAEQRRKLKDKEKSLRERINFLFYNAATESDAETLTDLYIEESQLYQDRRDRVDPLLAAAIKEQINNPSISTVMYLGGVDHFHGIMEALKAESFIDDIVMIYVVPVDKDAMEQLREHGVFKFGGNKYVWPVYDPNPDTSLDLIGFILRMYERPHDASYSAASEILAHTGERAVDLSLSGIIEQCPSVN